MGGRLSCIAAREQPEAAPQPDPSPAPESEGPDDDAADADAAHKAECEPQAPLERASSVGDENAEPNLHELGISLPRLGLDGPSSSSSSSSSFFSSSRHRPTGLLCSIAPLTSHLP